VVALSTNKKVLLVTRPNTWDKLSKDPEKVWPVSGRNSKIFGSLKEGEEIIVYLSQKSAFAGILEVSKVLRPSQKPIIYMGDVYDYFIKVEYKTILDENNLLPIKKLINQLHLTKDKKNWGAILQRAALRITDEDFKLIHSKINEIKLLT
jgi:hypothetical protein